MGSEAFSVTRRLGRQKNWLFVLLFAPDKNSCSCLLQARDLAAKDANGLSDPYVRVTLLPGEFLRQQVQVQVIYVLQYSF